MTVERNAKHLAWVRDMGCAIPGCMTRMQVQAHHVRAGGDGGMGMKPSDASCVPLCFQHHREGHNTGWKTFDAKYGTNLKLLAETLWRHSPHA